MEIAEIKGRLTLSEVLQHYGLKPDKHARLHCPFHEDKTPSLQVYYKTHTAYCFSSNCKTHGKGLDVIDFILHKEGCTKGEAIKKAESLINGASTVAQELSRTAVLTKMFTYFKNSVHNSPPARDYLAGRGLDFTRLEVGYNTGQFHHGTRKEEALIASCVKAGLLSPFGTNTRAGGQAYKPFAKECICFALRDPSGQVAGLYFRSAVNDKDQRHFYLKDRQGLYPRYPKAETKKLILTESVIDAATLLQNEEVSKDYETLALYGTNGFTEEHREAIRQLKELEEVIFFLNGDEPGRKAAAKYTQELKAQLPHVTITNIEPPEGEDVNSLMKGHEAEILSHLITQRTALVFSEEIKPPVEKESGNARPASHPKETPAALDTSDPYNLYYPGKAADYYIKGGIRSPLDALKISLQVVHRPSRMDYRSKADLYEHRQVESIIKSAVEKLSLSKELVEEDFTALTSLAESYRKTSMQEKQSKVKKTAVQIPEAVMNQCLDFLQAPKLMERINQLLGKSGITGEEQNRLFLFTIASSYKMPDTLHALIQGSSGSGKTRLLKIICELMPQEDVIKFTRVTDNSFYNYQEDYLVNKLLGFEDLDGLKEEAMYAVRELISNEILTSSTTAKTEDGQIVAIERTVRGPIGSLSCTTKGAVYEDNMSRVFLIAVDESAEQTRRIIQYQQQKAAGLIDKQEEKKAREFLSHCVRILKPCEVVNPYAAQLHLPAEAHKIRRLNDLYLSFVRQITLLQQRQRQKDRQGRLITTKEDLRAANAILFESIVLKVDELDGSLRQFFEALKAHLKEKGDGKQEFILRDIRHALKVSKTQLHRYTTDLAQLEYLQQSGHPNRGYTYKIAYWDNQEALREKIKQQLEEQINALKESDQ